MLFRDIISYHALAGNGSVTPHIMCAVTVTDQISSSLRTSVNISDIRLDSDIQHHLALAVSLCVCLTLKTCSNCISAVSGRSPIYHQCVSTDVCVRRKAWDPPTCTYVCAPLINTDFFVLTHQLQKYNVFYALLINEGPGEFD